MNVATASRITEIATCAATSTARPQRRRRPGATLSPAFKARGTKTKIILKKLAERYIPRETIYRRKVGFTVPLTPWFNGPLRGFVRGVLLDDRALERGYFRPQVLRRVVEDHLEGRVDHGRSLWTLLALEIWHRLFVDDDGSEAASARLAESIQKPATDRVAGGVG